jgi:hypothetical protein
MNNFNNNYNAEYEGDNNFYDDFSSMQVSDAEVGEEEVSDAEVSDEEAPPVRHRKRRRATTPPRKRKRHRSVSPGPSICSRIINFLGATGSSLFFMFKK